MSVAGHLQLRTTLLALLFLCTTAGAEQPITPPAPVPTPLPAPPTEPPPADTAPSRQNLHCYQCTGESTDPDDHCTDSGWISIPHSRKLDYRYLCPGGMNDFCMKTIERWESRRPGVADKYRTRRGCSGKTRTSQQSGSKLGAGTKFIVSNGCTDSRQNPTTGAFVQLCFCDQPLCNIGGRQVAPSSQQLLLLLLPLISTRL